MVIRHLSMDITVFPPLQTVQLIIIMQTLLYTSKYTAHEVVARVYQNRCTCWSVSGAVEILQ